MNTLSPFKDILKLKKLRLYKNANKTRLFLYNKNIYTHA